VEVKQGPEFLALPRQSDDDDPAICFVFLVRHQISVGYAVDNARRRR
jgi:hypothetical protein